MADDAKVYQLKITLMGIKPPIWRRIQVLGDWSFQSLHKAIQDAMGWRHCHLYSFEARDHKENKKVRIDPSNNIFEDGLPDNKCLLKDYFVEIKDKAYYEYDMGDSWRHLVTLEKILPENKLMKYPRCLAGKRACPPEDCGGVDEYKWIVDVLKDKKHPEHEHYKSWIQDCSYIHFNPEHFKPETAFKDWDPAKVLEAAI